MGNEPKVTRIYSEGAFVPGEIRLHSKESFKAATQELADLIKGFVEKHGIEIIVGVVAPSADNSATLYQGAVVLANADLAVVALERLTKSVEHLQKVTTFNKQNQN